VNVERIGLGLLFLAAYCAGLAPAGDLIAQADTPEAKGRAIAEAADRADRGWHDWSAEAELLLRDADGQTGERRIVFRTPEGADEGDKRLIILTYPRVRLLPARCLAGHG
jgi:hypothetical protein